MYKVQEHIKTTRHQISKALPRSDYNPNRGEILNKEARISLVTFTKPKVKLHDYQLVLDDMERELAEDIMIDGRNLGKILTTITLS